MIGQTISHYRITGQLGQGGMGVVYKAEDTILHRPVVLKFITPQEAVDGTSAKRFIREAQAAASLNHPNIATIYEYSQIEDPSTRQQKSFIAMEYIEGETVGERIARGPLTIGEASALLRQVALGLGKAHQHGIVHRDVKPANIIVATDGNAKILDFGLARLANRSSVSASDAIMGTASYMSPEQVRGGDVDHRTDIWSFGVVLFETLTGKKPFPGEHPAAVMYEIAHEPAPPLANLRPDAPANLQELCRDCLQKDPGLRPQSMDEVLRCLDGGKLLPREKAPGVRTVLKRRRVIWIASGSVLVVVLLWLTARTFLVPRPAENSNVRLAIIPFHNLTGEDVTADWPFTVQVLFVQDLTGFDELGVIDPTSLNGLMESSLGTSLPAPTSDLSGIVRAANLKLLIEGSIARPAREYQLQARLVNAASGEVLSSREEALNGEADLPKAVRGLSQQFLAFVQVEFLHSRNDQDLRPWIGRRMQNVDALKAFMQATDRFYKGEAGAPFLRRALELDSLFISPRVWLISTLVHGNKMDEAKAQYAFLTRVEGEASPFERAMIDWAGADIAQDTMREMRCLERALDFAPQNNILLYNLALLRAKLKDDRGAVEAIQPALAMKWGFSPAYYLAAHSEYRLGNRPEAERILQQALPVRPADPGIYALLSIISFQERDTAHALVYAELFRNCYVGFGVKLDVAHAALAENYADENLLNEAERSLRRAIALVPGNAGYHSDLARILRSGGDRKEALTEYLIAAKLDSSIYATQRLIGELLEELGDSVSALPHYKAFLQHDTLSAEARPLMKRFSTITH